MSDLAQAPYFDELEVGRVFDRAPSITLAPGLAAAHRGILGDRLRLTLDDDLAAKVTGEPTLAAPSLVWNVAIGQSTIATQHVKANLFYRRLALLRQPRLGDTLSTVTTVVGLRENARREGRAPTGLAALHMRTVDQHGHAVLDFYRCAMLPLRGSAATGHADDLTAVGREAPSVEVEQLVPQWDEHAWRERIRPARAPREGLRLAVPGGDVVTSAPELARLTLNIASAHHDRAAAGGQRLVYGGHTIGIALAQVSRALPDIATVISWESCDHLNPVYEGDTLRTDLEVERTTPVDGWTVVHLRARVRADDRSARGAEQPGDGRAVLDWRFAVLTD